eukprot:s2990_g10.t1
MSLEPLRGVGAVSLLDDDDAFSTRNLHCVTEPNTAMVQSTGVSWTFMMVCGLCFFAVCMFLFKVYRMASDALEGFNGLYTDVAMIESALERIHNELQDIKQQLRRTQAGFNELQGELEMLCDSNEQIHWGLINFGGYSNFHQMNPGQRQHMYALDRANLVASRAMGMQRYVQTIREANRGIVHGGQDTDVGMVEEAESEGEPTNDPEVNLAPEQGDFTQVLDTFRNELNDCLRRESWTEAWQIQDGCMQLLDIINREQPVSRESRRQLFENLPVLMRTLS